MSTLPPEQQGLARARARQLFLFLKAYSERRVTHRLILKEHDWWLKLRDLPAHSAIAVGEVLLNTGTEAEGEPRGNGALLTVRRPRLIDAPSPPLVLSEWLESGWQQPDGAVRVRSERFVDRGHGAEAEPFDADRRRAPALAEWQAKWESWAASERPARTAMKVFERLYQLYSRVRLESEQVELMLGDGQLRWQPGLRLLDHPVLLQRVELVFDPDVPELRLEDTDRAPELYAALLEGTENLRPEKLTELRQDLELRGYHPLEHEATSGFLKRLVNIISPARGVFQDSPSDDAPSANPVLTRDATLFLRPRVSGYSAAFDRILEELEDDSSELPAALTRLVGIEPPTPPRREEPLHSPWGEPPDILLSKPANSEQIAIARALDRYRAVQVQGPPGTGKSHTIANLIGHLVAQGKRVLVTSHTTKALSVLRNHIVEPLRPLAVAVLENDLEGRSQMEEAVRQILARLSEDLGRLTADVARLTSERAALNTEIDRVTAQLLDARIGEYDPITLGGQSSTPAEAARWVRANAAGNDWIPAPVQPGAPLPLAGREIAELYASHGIISASEETELESGLPDSSGLPAAEEFAELVDQALAAKGGEGQRYWSADPVEAEHGLIGQIEAELKTMSEELCRLSSWETELVRAGHTGGTDVVLWMELAEQLRAAHDLWDRSKALLFKYDPRIPLDLTPTQLTETYSEILKHVEGGGSLGWLTLLRRPHWKKCIAGSRVDGDVPSIPEQFLALNAEAELLESRQRLAVRWQRQAVAAGFPELDSLGAVPESKLLPFAERIETCLERWPAWWKPLSLAMEVAGLNWQLVRDEALASLATADPFERDVALVAQRLYPLLSSRLAVCRSRRASRLLGELQALLSEFQGPAASRLRLAVEARDPEAYGTALAAMGDLARKQALFERRRESLTVLESTAVSWAGAIRERLGLHGAPAAPGDIDAAWRWRQFDQELQRRASLDERELGRQLELLRHDLRRTTADLIERRSWQAQVERVDLRARQALQGWAATQRKIGRGTGKRAPELKAQARRLLMDAQDAVPVWIMPLSRVAESFQSSKRRFDVVIVDEASQSDVQGLLGWYLGDRVLVVGDDEQVSPLDVGQQTEETTALIAQYLGDIPNAHLYDGKTSIYDLAGQCFGGTIRLREHFRCVPAIIEFSNWLSYSGEIRPLRNPASAPVPHTIEYVVPASAQRLREGKQNVAEARMVVALLRAMTEDAAYHGKSFGAISLVGDEQAGLIQELALADLGAVELEARRFAAGSSAQFQGDERDVILLSMVDTPTGAPLTLRQTPLFKQRYNVAASRAKDQVWLVHSLDPDRDLKAADLRRELIAHVRDPEARLRRQREAEARTESPFEAEVARRLAAAGYEVRSQVWVGNYRIDLVVGSGRGQVAVECDGARYHGVDRIPDDMARQAILERAGWRFVRIRGTRFYRDPEGAMEWVLAELERLGATQSAPAPEPDLHGGDELRDRITRRAWAILEERGWVPVPPGSDELPGLGTPQ